MLDLACEILFWIGIIWIGYVYVGYPVLLWLIGLLRSPLPVKTTGELPTVSVLLAARNEEKDIGWKIRETLAWDYPTEKLELLVASDASEDGTNDILRSVNHLRFRYLLLQDRTGKNEALNQLNQFAQGDLLFFSDANSHIGGSCLRQIVSHFSDPLVGCVTGIECTTRGTEDSSMTAGVQVALGYESIVNTLENRLRSVLVCDGSIFCIRRILFGKLQPELANDFELPARIGAEGYAILFDPLVVSSERATSSFIEEFHRRRRICGQGILASWRLRHCFHGLRAFQLLSRKFLRWFGAIPMCLVLLSNLWLTTHPFYALTLILQTIFYGFTLLGWWFATQPTKGRHITTFPFYFVMVNVAALVGVLETMLGRRFSIWEIPLHSRGVLKNAIQTGSAHQHGDRASRENAREAIK